jgi:Protein of unknown function (DUF3096)
LCRFFPPATLKGHRHGHRHRSFAAIVALVAGILILVMPRLLNFIVAIYLILVGVMGLGLIK